MPKPFQLIRAQQEDALDTLKTTMGMDHKVRPFINSPNLTRDTVIGDLTFATFTGGAAKTVTTWSDPYNDPLTGQLVIRGEAVPFICTGNPANETVRGYAVLDDMDALVGAAYLDTPVTIAAVGDGVEIEPVIDAPAFGVNGVPS